MYTNVLCINTNNLYLFVINQLSGKALQQICLLFTLIIEYVTPSTRPYIYTGLRSSQLLKISVMNKVQPLHNNLNFLIFKLINRTKNGPGSTGLASLTPSCNVSWICFVLKLLQHIWMKLFFITNRKDCIFK